MGVYYIYYNVSYYMCSGVRKLNVLLLVVCVNINKMCVSHIYMCKQKTRSHNEKDTQATENKAKSLNFMQE